MRALAALGWAGALATWLALGSVAKTQAQDFATDLVSPLASCSCDLTPQCDPLSGSDCECDPDCSRCTCDVSPQCDNSPQCRQPPCQIDSICTCDNQCVVGPIHVGRIAARGIVLYKQDVDPNNPESSYSAFGLNGKPRWVEYRTAATADGDTRKIGEMLPLGTGGGSIGNTTVQFDMSFVPMAATEFNGWIASVEEAQTDGVETASPAREATIAVVHTIPTDSTSSPRCLGACRERDPSCTLGDSAHVNLETHTLLYRMPLQGVVEPCASLIIFQSPVAIQEQALPETHTSLLFDPSVGRKVYSTPHTIAHETAFMSLPEDVNQTCKVPTAPVQDPTQADIDAWRFVVCAPGEMLVDETPGDGGADANLRAWSPIWGVEVEMANYGGIRTVRTDRFGHYQMYYRVLPGSIFDFNVFATLRYGNFNPRISSGRSFFMVESSSAWRNSTDSISNIEFNWLDSKVVNADSPNLGGTTVTFSNFPVEAALVTSTARFSNAGLRANDRDLNPPLIVPLVDLGYDLELNPIPVGSTATETPAELVTKYELNPGESPNRQVGLLKQISVADARDTDVHVYRVADGRLVGSRWGLTDGEVLYQRAGESTGGSASFGPIALECQVDAAELAEGRAKACLQLSALIRGPAARYLSTAPTRYNPAAANWVKYCTREGGSCSEPCPPNASPAQLAEGCLKGVPQFGIELDYPDDFDPREIPLREGDQVKIVIVNRATGYMSTELAVMERGVTGMPTFKRLAAPGQTLANQTPLLPPNLKIRAIRKAELTDQERRRILDEIAEDDPDEEGDEPVFTPENEFVIGFEGSGRSDDQWIVIETEWYAHDDSPLPEELPGFTGRLAKVVEAGSFDDGSIPVDGGYVKYVGATQQSASEVPTIDPLDPSGGNEDQVGLFPIRPGKHRVIVRLPDQTLDKAHFYVHVDAAPMERNVDFSGRRKPGSADFSVNEVCYSNCGLKQVTTPDPDDDEFFVEDNCFWECMVKEGGAGEGPLVQRPASFVPFMVPVFDAAGTRALLELSAAALKSDDPELTGTVLPSQHDLIQHNWVYRPEYQFSLFDLEVQTSFVTTIDGTSLNLDYGIMGSSDPSLDLFGNPTGDDLVGGSRELVFSIGYETLMALVGESGVEFEADQLPEGCEPIPVTSTSQETNVRCTLDTIEELLKLSPSAQLDYVDGIYDALEPGDYLTISLYQQGDEGNVLVELLGLPPVLPDVRRLSLERRYQYSSFPESDVVPPGAPLEDAGISYVDGYEELKLVVPQKPEIDPVTGFAPSTHLKAEVVTGSDEPGQETVLGLPLAESTVQPGRYSLFVDYASVEERTRGAAGVPGLPLSPEGTPWFFIRITAQSLGVNQTIYYPVTLSEQREGMVLGQIIVHDVLVQDGSLNLTREDMAVKGNGPQISFVRSYTNTTGDAGDSVLGIGWSHSLDKRLQVSSTASQDGNGVEGAPGALPTIVTNHRGEFASETDLADERADTTGWAISVVSVNGTTFRQVNGGAWVPDAGRHGELDMPTSCTGLTAASKCYRFTAKDGTKYYYDAPTPEGQAPPSLLLDEPTSLSVEDSLIYRLYDGGTGPDVLELPSDEEPPTAIVQSGGELPYGRLHTIEDRNNLRLQLSYEHDDKSLVTKVTDAAGRVSCLYYERVILRRPATASTTAQLRDSPEQRLKVVVGPYAPGEAPDCKGELPRDPDSETDAAQALDVAFPVHTMAAEKRPIVLTFDYYENGYLKLARRGLVGHELTREEEYTYAAVLDGSGLNLASTEIDGSRYSYAYYQPADVDDLELGESIEVNMRPGDVVKSVTYPSAGAKAPDVTYPDGVAQISVDDADVGTATFSYTRAANGNRERTVTDLRGAETGYVLDLKGHPIEINGPGGARTKMKWDASANLEYKHVRQSSSPERWVSTFFAYDDNGNVTTETGPSSSTSEPTATTCMGTCPTIVRTWNAFSQMLTRADRSGAFQTAVLSGDDFAVEARQGRTETWTYETDTGALKSYTDAEGDTTTYVNNPRGSIHAGLHASETPAGLSTTTATEFTYDDFGNPATVKLPHEGAHVTTTYEYDVRGRLISMIDARMRETKYEYDALDNQTLIRYPSPNAVTRPTGAPANEGWNVVCRRYDSKGNKLVESDRNGVFLEYGYTGRNQVASVSRGTGQLATGTPEPCQQDDERFGSKSFYYDRNGNLTAETDWKGSQTRYRYNDLDQRVETQNRLGHTMTEAHDLAGNLVSVTDFADTTTETLYDGMNRPVHVCEGVGSDVARQRHMTYFAEQDPELNLASSSAWYELTGSCSDSEPPAGTPITRYLYDGRYKRTQTTDALDGRAFAAYDERGNVIRTQNEAGEQVKQVYDPQNRVTELHELGDPDEGAGDGPFITTFQYDPNGNRTLVARSRTGTPVVPAIPGGTTEIEETEYDAWNRRQKVTVPADESGNTPFVTFTYDGEGNVIHTLDRRGNPTTTERDDLGRPEVVTDREGNATRYRQADGSSGYDLNGNVLAVQVERADLGSARVLTTTTYDNEDRPLVITEASGDSSARTTTFEERDEMGNALLVRDVRGMYVRTIYDALHRPEVSYDPSPTDPGAGAPSSSLPFVRRSYYANGKPRSETNRNGHETRSFCDALERLVAVRDPIAENGAAALVNGESHDAARTFYDAAGRVTHIVGKRRTASGEASVTENVYDSFGRLSDVYRYRLAMSAFTASSGEVQTVTAPAARPGNAKHISHYEYDNLGNRVLEADANGHQTEHRYDNRNQLRVSILPLTTLTQIEEPFQHPGISGQAGRAAILRSYDANGNLSVLVDENGRRTDYTFDREDRRTAIAFLPGSDDEERTLQVYDEVGNLVEAIRPEGLPGGLAALKCDPAAASAHHSGACAQKMTYDALNRLVGVTDERGVSTRYGYDDGGNLTHVCEPKDKGVDPSTDALTGCDAARENHIEYTYDARSLRLQHIQHRDSGNLVTDYLTYDKEGNLIDVRDPMQRTTHAGYDELNRRTSVSYEDVAQDAFETTSTSFEYDANDAIVYLAEHKVDPAGATFVDVTRQSFDLLDRPQQRCERRRLPSAVAYAAACTGAVEIALAHDDNGNRTSVAVDTRSTTYQYDARNRLGAALIQGSEEEAARYQYFADGRLGSIALPNESATSYQYHATGRVREIDTDADITGMSMPERVARHQYQYDRNGNRTRQDEELWLDGALDDETTLYEYDAANQLTRFDVGLGGGDGKSVSYTYKGYNRATEVERPTIGDAKGRSYVYDETNRLNFVHRYDPDTDPVPTGTTATPTSLEYQYDPNGNTTRRLDHADTTENLAFDYDARNQLVIARDHTTQVVGRHDYNASGLRTRHLQSDRGDVEYFYDERAVLEERHEGTAALLAHYRYSDRLLRLDDPARPAGPQYYHHDALGSTVALSDDSAYTINPGVHTYRLDPWGNVTRESGTASLNRRIFTGHEHDQNTGLIYAGARYYDPETGRFITQDSYLGVAGTPPSLHRYLYAFGNPTVWIDPTGNRNCAVESCSDAEFKAYNDYNLAIINQQEQLAFAPTEQDLALQKAQEDRKRIAKKLTSDPSQQPGWERAAPDGKTQWEIKDHEGRVVEVIKCGGPDCHASWRYVKHKSGGKAAGATLRALGEAPGAIADGLSEAAANPLDTGRKLVDGVKAAPGKVVDAIVSLPEQGEKLGYALASSDPTESGDALDAVLFEGTMVATAAPEAIGALEARLSASSAKKALSGACCCFVAGTLVSTVEGPRSIDEVELGTRVLPSSSECEQMHVDGWVAIDVALVPEGSDHLYSISLLRSSEWVAEAGIALGGYLTLELSEIGLSGEAWVQELRAGPEVPDGMGCPVTAIIRHVGEDIVNISFADGTEALEVTASHRLYSESRKDWVSAGTLMPGESLQTRSGSVAVAEIARAVQAAQVFNLEVGVSHEYFVQENEVLTHNACVCGVKTPRGAGTPVKAPSGSGTPPAATVVEEFDTIPYGQRAPDFEKHHGVLDKWAAENIPGYVSRSPQSTSIAMKPPTHAATKEAFRKWLKERTGKAVGGSVDWKKVSAREAQELAEKMFDAAKVPPEARRAYYQQFHRHIYGKDKL